MNENSKRKVHAVCLAQCPCAQVHLVMIDAEGKEFAELTMTPAVAQSLGKAMHEAGEGQQRRYPGGIKGGRAH